MMKDEGYQAFPNTHWSLVRRAGLAEAGARREALGVLLGRYAPALRSYLRVVKGMAECEVEDLVQGFIAEKVLEGELLAKADVERGRFRTFLLTSLNNFVVSRWRAEGVRRGEKVGEEAPNSGTNAPNLGDDAPGFDRSAGGGPMAEVEVAWARALVRDVLTAMRRECEETGRGDVWRVFEGRVVAEAFGEGVVVGYEALAGELGLKVPGQAANLLVTGKRMYARLLRRAVGEYERDEAGVEEEILELRRVLARGGGDEFKHEDTKSTKTHEGF